MAIIRKKRCTKCKEVKEITEFAKRKGRLTNRASQCKECRRQYDQNHKHKRHDVSRKRINEYRNNGIVRHIVNEKISRSKTFAKRRGYVGCITPRTNIIKSYTTICVICLKDAGIRICLDHCHTTGQFRGFICRHCNNVIGYANDNIEILRKAIEYLETHKQLTREYNDGKETES